jgi:hypothetical protein
LQVVGGVGAWPAADMADAVVALYDFAGYALPAGAEPLRGRAALAFL